MPELISDFKNVIEKDVYVLIQEQRKKEAVNNMAGQDAQLMAQTFGAGAGSMGGENLHKETQMLMKIEILTAKEERLAKKLQYTNGLYRNAEKSLIQSE